MQVDSPLDDPYPPKRPPGENELPYDDGVPMDSNEHRLQMVLLIQSLKEEWAARDDFFVAGNMFIYFSEAQTKQNDFRGPDVFVVLGTNRRSRKSWVVWEENGKLPDVVIELLSPSTERIDRVEKMRIYAKVWRLPEYFLFDPFSHRLEGFRLDAGALEYAPIAPSESGDLPSNLLGLSLGVRRGIFEDVEWQWLRWIRRDGALAPTPQERVDVERARADAERARADAERARADAERARADAERARAEQLDRQLRDLEAERRRR